MTSRLLASLPPGMTWPRSLQGCSTTTWRRLSIGVRWCRLRLPSEGRSNVFLVRVAPGRGLPVHSHRGGDVTQVLFGSFEEDAVRYEVGDFDQADGSVHHRPVASATSECICLIAVEGRMAFHGPMARAMGALLHI